MCLILLAWHAHPEYRLVLAANRDEFYRRPTAAAAFWEDAPELLAGRDLTAGGTWLGVTRSGRFAAVTNLRGLVPHREDAASRGALVAGFLREDAAPERYARDVSRSRKRYNGFSLLVGDRHELWFCTNGGEGPRAVPPGIHGLSNHTLDTPWPKVEKGKRELRDVSSESPVDRERLFGLLGDRTAATDDTLPDTGVGLALERRLSPIYVATSEYGTRCSTVVLAGRDGRVDFEERSFAPTGELVNVENAVFYVV